MGHLAMVGWVGKVDVLWSWKELRWKLRVPRFEGAVKCTTRVPAERSMKRWNRVCSSKIWAEELGRNICSGNWLSLQKSIPPAQESTPQFLSRYQRLERQVDARILLVVQFTILFICYLYWNGKWYVIEEDNHALAQNRYHSLDLGFTPSEL